MATFATFLRHGSNAVLLAFAAALIVLFASRELNFASASFHAAPIAVGARWHSSSLSTRRIGSCSTRRRRQNAFILRLQHRLHYDHHITPAELSLLFLPIWFVLPVAALTFAIYYGVTRDLAISAALLLGSAWSVLVRMGALRRPHRLGAADGLRALDQEPSLVAPLQERADVVRGDESQHGSGRRGTYARVEEVERTGTTRALFRSSAN